MYKTKVKLFDEFLILNPTIIKYFLDLQLLHIARVAELVDALDSKSSFFGSAGSIPASSTNIKPHHVDFQYGEVFLSTILPTICQPLP